MDKEIEEMQKIICDKCICIMGVEGKCSFCVNASEALINAGYHKTEVKTNGDYIRKSVVKSDEELAYLCWAGRWDDNANKPYFISTITHSRYDTSEEAYNANLEWLKKEYKGE